MHHIHLHNIQTANKLIDSKRSHRLLNFHELLVIQFNSISILLEEEKKKGKILKSNINCPITVKWRRKKNT